jgi:hypothetical protein
VKNLARASFFLSGYIGAAAYESADEAAFVRLCLASGMFLTMAACCWLLSETRIEVKR